MLDLSLFNNRPWLLDETQLRLAVAKLNGFKTCYSLREVAEERKRRMEFAREATSRAVRASSGKVAMIGVYGPVDQRMTSALMKAGGTSTEEVGMSLDAIAADKSIGTVVMEFDSPGGVSYGTAELADKVFSMREQKRMYAMVNSMACSAAYWIASACETVVITPGGDAGSIGVYAIHADESKALEEEGIRVTMVKAGRYKAEWSSHEALSEAARDYLQESVDETYSMFINAVAKFRGVSVKDVREKFGQGRSMGADRALAAGLVDRVMSADELMGRLLGKPEDGKKAASTEVLRLRHQHQKEMCK